MPKTRELGKEKKMDAQMRGMKRRRIKEAIQMDYEKKIADLKKKIEDQQKEIDVCKKALEALGVNLEAVRKASEK